MQIITDVNEVSKKEDITCIANGINVEKDSKTVVEYEIKKIIELFDKKKTIVIPRAEDFSKKPAPTQSSESGNYSTLNLSYKQTEFFRPKHFIVYSEKNRLEPKEKDYEASISDINFLSFEKFFISIEQLERIISALENDINKGEMIPPERAKEIIANIIPDKKDHVDKVYKVNKSYLLYLFLFFLLNCVLLFLYPQLDFKYSNFYFKFASFYKF